MSITLPSKLKSILETDSKLYAATLSSVANISELLEENSLYFFEEYTDHGIKHIQSVLESCQDIIEENTLSSLLSPVDIALLIHAVLLHDIGMHTTLGMFNEIINGAYDNVLVSYFDDKTWKQEWEEYLDEAKKFNSNQKKQIFGDEFIMFKIPNLNDKNSITTVDKKLIGEFIRRNHTRLAHEISLMGSIIGLRGSIDFASDFEKYQKDLAGLIARSHGINVRETFDYLKNKHSEYEWANPYSVKVIYLMIVIRIADYFQFDSKRISIQSLKIKTFSTPFSEFEHLKHLSVKFVQPSHIDNETLIVETEPKDSFMFISLTNLLKDIQKEMDISWAILGEIYGKDPDIKKPKLKFRRIKSNLDDKKGVYVRNLNYVPEAIKFSTDLELLKLLAAPLYGNNPTYGVRELLQNSVDACRERKTELNKASIKYESRIEVALIKKNDKYEFLIEDNGKGMTLFEIKNYFLKAGSSFRKSLDWKKNFTDELGKSIIARNGKFGIGVLAAFLLGSEINVQTRSNASNQSYEFNASIDSNQIEIAKSSKKEIGTRITIKIDEEIYQSLTTSQNNDIKWYQWYTSKTPAITYHLEENGVRKSLPQNTNFIPSYTDKESAMWNKITPVGYNSLFWTYNPPEGLFKNFDLICNGIVIPKGSIPDHGYRFLRTSPKVCLYDFDGILNLNLNRNFLDKNTDLSKELLYDIYADIVAKLLTFSFKEDQKYIDAGHLRSKAYILQHESLYSHYYNNYESIGFSRNGYFLFQEDFLKHLPERKLTEIVVENESDDSVGFFRLHVNQMQSRQYYLFIAIRNRSKIFSSL